MIGDMILERVRRANDAVRMAWLTLPGLSAASVDDDADDIEVEDEDTTAPIVFDMRYRNAKGEVSERRVRLIRVSYNDTEMNFGAWCYWRERYRLFKASNVAEIIDLTTGEVFSDPRVYFEGCGVFEGQSPESRALEICRDDISVLTLVASCDGRFLAVEADEIVKHVFSRAAEELDEHKIRCVVAHMAPDEKAARAALRRIKGRPEAKRYLLRSLRRVIDADGVLHANEVVLADEIVKVLG